MTHHSTVALPGNPDMSLYYRKQSYFQWLQILSQMNGENVNSVGRIVELSGTQWRNVVLTVFEPWDQANTDLDY
jgi:hypothetical protein